MRFAQIVKPCCHYISQLHKLQGFPGKRNRYEQHENEKEAAGGEHFISRSEAWIQVLFFGSGHEKFRDFECWHPVPGYVNFKLSTINILEEAV